MTTMNNEDPADPSVHEPRGLDWPEPVAYLHDVVAADGEPDQALSFAPDNFPLMGVGGFRSVAYRPLYTADQMREAIAAERERSHELLQAADHIRAVLEAELATLRASAASVQADQRAEIDAANAALDELRADAERYRWLRAKSAERPDFYSGEESWMVSRAQGGMGQNFFGEKIDAAIDAARALRNKEQG